MKTITAAAKCFILLLVAVRGSPHRCAPGQFKDPDRGCMKCAYCTRNHWTQPQYYLKDCHHNSKAAVTVRGYEHQPWCTPGVRDAFYDVCEFPQEVGGAISCAKGPLPGNECNLTCDSGEVINFICQLNTSKSVPELCPHTQISASTELPFTITSDFSTPGINASKDLWGLPPEYIVPLSVVLPVLCLLLLGFIVWRCCRGRRNGEGSNENLTVKIDHEDPSTSSNESEPSSSDSLLDDNKDARESKKEAAKDGCCDIVETNSSRTCSNHGRSKPPFLNPGGLKEVTSEPESLPPPYTSKPLEWERIQGQQYVGPMPDDSHTEPKVPLGSHTPALWKETPGSNCLQVFSGLEGIEPGNRAVMMSMQSCSPSPSLSEDLEPDLDPEHCSHLVSLLFTQPEFRHLLEDLKLQLEPLNWKKPNMTMVGLSMHCLGWSRSQADRISWARRENLQESPAFVTLQYMSQEGLKLGHIALYFSKREHRNRNIVALLQSAESHQQCPLCSQL